MINLARATVLSSLLLLLPGCTPDCEEVSEFMPPHAEAGEATTVTAGASSWTRWTIDPGACGAAFVTVADLDDDGAPELLVSRYGKRGTVPFGEVTSYSRDGDLGSWTRSPVATRDDQVRFPARTGVGDVDGDGDLDVVVPVGFFVCSVVPGISDCGGLLWFENDGGSFIRHDIVAPEETDFYHQALLADLDGDGALDLLSVAEQHEHTAGDGGRAELQLFRNDGAGYSTSAPEPLASGLGTIPRLADIDQDGDLDVYGAEFFRTGGSFAWIEQVTAPSASDSGSWARHVIDDGVGPAIDLVLVPDLRGDGATVAVGTNHTNPARNEGEPEPNVYLYEVPADPTAPWDGAPIAHGLVSEDRSGQAAPGIVGTGDADGDGDIDLLVSGDGDPRVFLFEQTDDGFVQHTLEPDLPQAGGMQMADLDGDGDLELIVTGYDDDVVYVYERQ